MSAGDICTAAANLVVSACTTAVALPSAAGAGKVWAVGVPCTAQHIVLATNASIVQINLIHLTYQGSATANAAYIRTTDVGRDESRT